MYLDTRGPTMTYEGLPIDVDCYMKQTDMTVDPTKTKEICFKAPTTRDQVKVTRYWVIVLSFNAAGHLLKQAAAVEYVDPPSWIAGL